MITLPAMAWTLAISSQANPPPQKWLLGSVGGSDLFVEIRLHLFDETNYVRSFDAHAVFTATRDGKTVRRIDRDLGQTFGGPTGLAVGPFLYREDREQLFITLTMGRVQSWVFDFDGKKVRAVYERTEGRVATFISPNDRGGWKITELWPKSQYEDHFPKPFKVRPDGCVLREVPVEGK